MNDRLSMSKDGGHYVGDDFSAFMSVLRTRIGSAAFASWMHDLRFEGRGEDEVTLSTSSEFKRMMIVQRYHAPMRDSWNEAVGSVRKMSLIARRQDMSAMAEKVAALAPQPDLRGGDRREPPAPSVFENLGSAVDPRLTFERFAVDESNRVAAAAARQILAPDAPDVVYVYGPSGVGKTHLLHAVANAWSAMSGDAGSCAYLTYSNFKNGCVDAVFTTNGLLELHRDLARRRVVLIDDVHLLASSVRTQMEMLNLLNAGHIGGRRVVIAGEAPPAELARRGMNERLVDRLAGGLCAAIHQGGEGLRREVLRKRLPDLGLDVAAEAVDFIAKHFTKSMREAIGALSQLKLEYSGASGAVGVEQAASALKDRLRDASRRQPTLDDALGAVAKAFSVTVEDLVGRRQKQIYAKPRHAFVLIARDNLKISYPKIAAALGRDHTTIMSSYDRGMAFVTRDLTFRTALAAARTELGFD